jgi:hypothetical protein
MRALRTSPRRGDRLRWAPGVFLAQAGAFLAARRDASGTHWPQKGMEKGQRERL